MKRLFVLAVLAMAALAAAPSPAPSPAPSAAHIGALQIGKDKALTPATSFGPHDKIFAKATAQGVTAQVSMKWVLVAENVAGQPANEAITLLDRTYDLPADGDSTYNLSPPDAGWPAGTYRIVVTLAQNAVQLDQQSQEFTVSASP